LSLAYALRYIRHIFLGPKKLKEAKEVPFYMKSAMIILVVLVIVLGIWPTFFLHLITTVSFV
jgi:NADH:ubiquinone oxidoreductase subunit 5 (subunit L)/multisubunit Na+/H+ antiporter MnhA subunit